MLPILPPILRAGTPDLPAVPRWLHAGIIMFLGPILVWAETTILRRIFTTTVRDHPLVRMGLAYDPAAVVAACAAYRHPEGTPGAPPTFTLEQLVRAEIVRTWAEGCSDRELAWHLASNLVVRWFVGLSLFAPQLPDHTTLARFHGWMRQHAPDALFRDVLTFLDGVDPEDAATTPQIVDTFAMQSPVAPRVSPAALLRHLTLRLLLLLRQRGPATLTAALEALDLTPFTHPKPARSAAARHARLQTTVALVARVVTTVTAQVDALDPVVHPLVVAFLADLAKVQADELTTDDAGVVTERPAKERGSRRIASAVDREATFRKHEGSPAVLGSNAIISTTRTRIRACVIVTGCTPDSVAPAAVLQQQQEAGAPLPEIIVMDGAAGWGKTRAEVHTRSDGQTSLVAPIPQGGGSDPARFSVADFQVDFTRMTCTCPGGKVSTTAYASGSADGITFRFRAPDCAGCDEYAQCRDPKAKPTSHRTVFISDYHHHMREAQRVNQSDAGKALLHDRWRVEPTIAWLTRYQGCRRARCIGLAAAQFELSQACAVRNLLSWLHRHPRRAAA
ncbi:transposase [Candidatus Chloroploca sp. Khr17]|uniref:transposase n=1 Tax=Candidatus Chloroploca sp. Khr17 TaxID=2496869 RepID=UPI00101DAF0A|nr:transposase [Candidatus Chloroploca sp. Khr17]